jgi:tRNA uridine 5-carboxymethylaminomethyl modification enzyme
MLSHVIPELAYIDPLVLTRVHIEGIHLTNFPEFLLIQTRIVGHYSAHLFRQEADLRLFMEDESLVLDPDMDYNVVEGLSFEVRERLGKVRPGTIASVSFVNPRLS